MRSFKLALCLVLLAMSGASAQITQTGAGVVAGGGYVPATPCVGTGLDFTVACNSQYIGIL